MEQKVIKIQKPVEIKTEENEEIGNNEMTQDCRKYVRQYPKIWVIKAIIEDHNGERKDRAWYFSGKANAQRRYAKYRPNDTDDNKKRKR